MNNATGWIAAAGARWSGLIGSAELYHTVLHSGDLKQEQSAILAKAVFCFVTLGLISLTLFGFAFRHQFNLYMLLAYAWIMLSYLGWINAVITWIRTRDHDKFVAVSQYIAIGLGAAWGLLVNLYAIVTTQDQKGLLIGLIMTLLLATAFGIPVSVGLALWLPTAVFCSLAVLYTLEPWHLVACASFLGFLAFSLIALLFVNKIILERSIGRINLQHQNRALNIFLRESEQNASDWLWETDVQGRLRNVTLKMAQIFGRDVADLRGVQVERLVMRPEGPAPAGAPDCDNDLALLLQQKIAFRDFLVLLDKPSGNRWLSLTGHPVFGKYGIFHGFRGVGTDVTDARLSQDRIEQLARHDGLTTLLNRQNFIDQAETAFSRALEQPGPQQHFALLLIDLDQFKGINDEYGHAAGDTVLVTVADRLRETVRQTDLAARLSGDEFAVLLRIGHYEDAVEIAERLLDALRRRIFFSGIFIHPHASIGVALFPEHAINIATLMKRADLALYEAKHQGRNMYLFFEEGLDEAFTGRLLLQTDLGVALERQEISVVYQPAFDIRGSQVAYVEALARWNHATRGYVPATTFIPMAEDAGVIDEIGMFVLHEACRTAAGWGGRMPVTVNISPHQLQSDTFLEMLDYCLTKSGLAPDRLALEVTEASFLVKSNLVSRQIEAIRRLGVRLILDNLGSGVASLSYLKAYDFDGIKIDAAFTRDLPESRKAGAIVRTVARLANELGVTLTAQGIESREQLIWLAANGIPLAQGHFLASPQTDTQITELLSAGGGTGSRILREI